MDRVAIVKKTIGYIENHLHQKLNLEIVAAGLHYSKCYLHRIFRDTVGMTIHDYVRRRQLTEGAKLLVFSEKSILEIALIAGYESQQAFTTIFKAMYKQSPSQFRRNERFYPLQLEFVFDKIEKQIKYPQPANDNREIYLASESEIPAWMELVKLVIDGFPYLEEEQYLFHLRMAIKKRQAFIMREGELSIGIMMLSRQTGNIDFWGIHPLYHKQGIARQFLRKATIELAGQTEIIITTYREGDKADLGHRDILKALGFAEAELLTEFGYPTQKFILKKSEIIENELF